MNAVIILTAPTDFEQEIIQRLTTIGYYNTWLSGTSRFILPHNTVWKPNIELNAAQTELNTIINQINTSRGITIPNIRYLILSAVPWVALLNS